MKNWIFLLAFVTTSSHAALIERDFLAEGDNGINYDPLTGLEWLDLTFTRGMSYSEASAYALFYGFRFATLTETSGMLRGHYEPDVYLDSAKAHEFGNTFGKIEHINGFWVDGWVEPILTSPVEYTAYMLNFDYTHLPGDDEPIYSFFHDSFVETEASIDDR